MNIQFDDNISPRQAQGLILLLTALHPELNDLAHAAQPVNSPQAQLSDPQEQSSLRQLQDSPGGINPFNTAGPTPINEPSTRKRRTKAEIAADELAAKQATSSAAEPGPGAEPTLQTAIEATTEPTPTPITKEELTSLTNGFIQRHSMEDAFAAINAFGCSRINEAMALPPEKLAALAEKLRG